MIKNYFLLSLILLSIFTSCKDVFEEEIDEETAYLIAPKDSFKTSNPSVTFWWDFVDGADKYNLQVVSPSYNEIETLILDTNVSSNQFTYTLNPGQYQWSVVAFNTVSESNYQIFTLNIDSTLDLSQTSTSLILPKDNLESNSETLTFLWSHIANADFYNFLIYDDNNQIKHSRLQIDADTFTYTVNIKDTLPEGRYLWAVYGINSTSGTTSKCTQRSFIYDTTAPISSSPIAPIDTIETSNVQFSWSRNNDSGSSISFDSVFIYKDSIINNTPKYKIKTTDTFQEISDMKIGKYYWIIKSTDKAGNSGNASSPTEFYIK